ncbi:hypothetical protein [Brumicola nitratireducens]|uniref:Uncharacterized protein n=1 Tax=Glaciecola nitratireducens (strain JCM 12485 / KCTC 12276 / FR1064) TaxID=1085623 RepID=G4QI78_GLANF|nr:hypothetical protein [Glaciecola nitratireducens]AEP30692.1 hypothetical protein GNIT_2595 [Glaciecola nitratireducens FR1064]
MLIGGDLVATNEILLFYALALLFLLVAVIYISRLSQKALTRYESRQHNLKGKDDVV